ncbi:hypothetical protein BDN72DRAFT_957580 [Pluteus cervinus]|uniref:Uncharacterized protein n=1 Tax=Pluteus cervinus TaxID=181527 RepID=A0ACD3B399_9AGAR|nr:hypothetical protein BDN72DRAFT_957580 [Pluteus cervinus]
MATKEEQEALRLLVQHVARGFYEPKFTIILDQLARHPVLKDDDLAGRMGLQPKELNKVIAVLSNDSLVKVYRQNELKEGAQRSVGRQYYYIDYEHFCNVVKWRIAKMRHIIDSSLRNELDNKGYICTQCKQKYLPLDVDKIMDLTLGIFVCEICHGEVVDNENAESVLGSKDRMQRFNHQMRFIREGLQKSESMVLPSFDVAAWVQNNTTEAEKQRAAQSSGGLKIAGSDPNKKDEDGIKVMITLDKDEATQKLERDAEAEAKRQQNALPAWHLKSTISGDLTALGMKEQARVDGMVAISGSNDEILRGLGVVGSKPLNLSSLNSAIAIQEETKPVINPEADLYDQYYASLAASTTVSAQATPTLSAPGSSDFGDFNPGEEEDKKPTIEYLDSLNDYRKRSRSREDDGARTTKIAKIEPTAMPPPPPPLTNGNGHRPEEMYADVVIDEGPPGDDPLVFVNGISKPYSQVTEEDHDLMTTDEYTAFFDIVQALS